VFDGTTHIPVVINGLMLDNGTGNLTFSSKSEKRFTATLFCFSFVSLHAKY
jgi:hypothetical protein